MSIRSQKEWPYVPLKSKRSHAVARWEEGAQAPFDSAALTRWGVLGLVLVAAAVTVLSGIAVAALLQDDTQATKQHPGPAEIAPGRVASDAHLQELLRDHRSAVSGN
jgi:hypothetical protein